MSTDNIQVIRLKYTMEELVVQVHAEDDLTISVDNPMTLVKMPGPQSKLQFIPWNILSLNRTFTFAKSDLLGGEGNPVPDTLVRAYIQHTTGIEIANTMPSGKAIEIRG